MIINLNCNNEVSNIISNKPGGVYRDFVLETNPVKKNELIVYASNFLSLKYNSDIFLESKISYGRRNKRIEILLKENNYITFCKITSIINFDQHCLELIDIMNEISKEYNTINFRSILIFFTGINKEIVENYLSKFNRKVDYIQISI